MPENSNFGHEKITLFHELCKQIKFKDWVLSLKYQLVKGKYKDIYIQWVFQEKCSVTGKLVKQRSRKWRISLHMTKTEFVNSAFVAAMLAVEHEVRESFKYKDQPIFCGHINVDDRADIMNKNDFVMDSRASA